ncbi:MAG: hypothetical protein H7124_03275 [Phycisphaerales bacterium]|nr:hypothetical protein [Hyphomonadaceae bacterium]
MRPIFAMLAMLVLAQCATPEDTRFRVGEAPRAFVVIGIAEAQSNTSPRYTMLWRRLDAQGRFTTFNDDTIFQPRTHMGNSVRVRGIPGEFAMAEVEPGVYALDSTFALIEDRRVNYSANGVIVGPERPSFEVRPGEAVYLGIWQLDLEAVTAVARPWRLDQADAAAAMRDANAVVGSVTLRQVQTRAVPCTPRQLNPRSQRQIC